jgi:hypothetical protein
MVALEFLQLRPGSIFDNILVTDDVAYAAQRLKEDFQFPGSASAEFERYKRKQADRKVEEERRSGGGGEEEASRQDGFAEDGAGFLPDGEFVGESSDENEVSESSATDSLWNFPSVEGGAPRRAARDAKDAKERCNEVEVEIEEAVKFKGDHVARRSYS